MSRDLLRPYLVIPKLIEQPTWGGFYISEAKNWQSQPEFQHKKIGQSYELFDKSNLSLFSSTADPGFIGELTDAKMVDQLTTPPQSLPISELLNGNPMAILIKFTQALGNSFQLHIKDGTTHPKWKPKPESWYYFEPGLVTLGAKEGVDWNAYESAMTELNDKILVLSPLVKSGEKTYESAKKEIDQLVKSYNPWQYVNTLEVARDSLVDLSPCGIHHSWEEDMTRFPLGNVVYELQVNVMDDVSTIRNFDKGKMTKDGTTRALQIKDYFNFIDRSPAANDPLTHMRKSIRISDNSEYRQEQLMKTNYYSLEKIFFKSKSAQYTDLIDSFRHLFVKSGQVELTAGKMTLTVTRGHSAFIPVETKEYNIKSILDNTEVLISY